MYLHTTQPVNGISALITAIVFAPALLLSGLAVYAFFGAYWEMVRGKDKSEDD